MRTQGDRDSLDKLWFGFPKFVEFEEDELRGDECFRIRGRSL
jgi:hypothetical protein